MSNFNSNSNIGRVLLIILTVVICISAIGGTVLGIINLNNRNAEKTNNSSLSTYPTEWYGDESYRYRLLSDTEMEIESKKVITGTIRPTVKYYSTESGELRAVYINAERFVQYKMTYTYSVRCAYDISVVNGEEQYTCKDIYFPGIEESPRLDMVYNIGMLYESAPTQEDITNVIRYSAATDSMGDHVVVDISNFQRFHNLHQTIHIILYDDNYMACDEIILNN